MVGARYETSSGVDGKWHLRDVTAQADRVVVDQAGNVGIGIGAATAHRQLHVEGSEVHSGGSGGGFSFADRDVEQMVNNPVAGERWVLYAAEGTARLWSGADLLSCSTTGEGRGLDVSRRMRVRQGGDASAGIWFHQTAPQADRAFIGMVDDTHVGLWGNTGADWGITMDTGTGDVRISGGLHVQGSISKGGGGFRIDHPLAPDSKYLSHSFVESSEMLTVYVGTVVTDEDGVAVVELPEYFDALNRDAQIQLTPVGQLALVAVDGAERENRFAIRSDKPGVTVSWLVTATRHDPWAEGNRIVVEMEKPPEELSAPGTHDDRTTQELRRPSVEIDDLEARLIQLQEESRLAQERLRALILQEAAMRETLNRIIEVAQIMAGNQKLVDNSGPLVG
jgi:hypothetical protein